MPRRTLLLTLLLLVLSAVPVAAYERDAPLAAPVENRVERLPGTSAVGFAVRTSQRMYADGEAPIVVLARVDAFPDALAGSSLLGFGPLLLTGQEALWERTGAEVDRVLHPDGTVLVLGGTSALTTDVADELRRRGHRVRRLAGDDRFETATRIADELVTIRHRVATEGRVTSGGPRHDRALPTWSEGRPPVVLARSHGPGTAAWADAVAVGAVAAWDHRVVLLTRTDQLSSATAAWVQGNSVREVVALGGRSAVGPSVLSRLRDDGAFPQVDDVRRVGGADRAATAVAIARELGDFPLVDPHVARLAAVTLVDGHAEDGWAIGLVAAGFHGSPSTFFDQPQHVLWTRRDEIDRVTLDAITTCAQDTAPVFLAGSTERISDAVRADLVGHTPPGCAAPRAHTFLAGRTEGGPVTYPACRPIPYVVNVDGAPAGAADVLASVVATIEANSGFRFVFHGTTTAQMDDARGRGTRSDAASSDELPVLVTWPTSWSLPARAVAVAGSDYKVGPGVRETYTTGVVTLQRGAISNPALLETILLHELLHVLGIGHVRDGVVSVMSASNGSDEGLSDTDRTALRELTAAAAC